MSKIYKLSGFQQELDKAERFFSMHLTRQELRNRLAEIERLNNIINTILDFDFLKNMCPLDIGFAENSIEEKAQEVFNENDYCKENCNDNYKKCWLKFFESLQELKGSDKE